MNGCCKTAWCEHRAELWKKTNQVKPRGSFADEPTIGASGEESLLPGTSPP
jgi:hypothetical protein